MEADEYIGKLKWLKSDRAAKASLLVREKSGKKRKKRDCRELIVIVAASWQFLDKLEATREDLEEGQIGALVSQWKFWEVLNYSGIPFEVEQDGAHLTSRCYYPKAVQLRRMAEESLKLVAAALEKLCVNQASQSWSRHLKPPDVFKPDTRDNELKMWSDWKFAFCSYIRGIDPAMAAAMDVVEKKVNSDYTLDDMTDDMKTMSVRLYSVLTSYLRNRPLKLVKHIKQENGFGAWQLLLKEMQPATRARSLALLTQLSRVQFAEGKSLSEQFPQYEAIVTEYERISGHVYADDAKVASILQGCPAYMKQHLQLWVDDSTTYDSLKAKVMQLESLSTRWDASNSLSLPTRAGADESTPMEVDYIGKSNDKGKRGGKKGKDGKGKAKGKDKGKSKQEGKGIWKSFDKGKSAWEKGQGKKGKNAEKGTKGKTGGCFICGKQGHVAKECWKRVQQVEENPGGAASSSSGQATAVRETTQVKMVRVEDQATEIFDLTQYEEVVEEIQHPWRVNAVYEEPSEEEFFDCREPVVWTPSHVPVIAMDMQMHEVEEKGAKFIQMVKVEAVIQDSCLVTLDSGADVSVLPLHYGEVGTWRPGSEKLKMVDAQGTKIAHQGLTKAKIKIEDSEGKDIELIEEFVLGNVQHPILCAGRLLRKGWSISGGSDGKMFLFHEERNLKIPINTERNSLQFEARIFGVEVEEQSEKVSQKEDCARVYVLRGFLSKYVEELELPPGVIVYSDPVAIRLADARQSVDGEWKARMTLMKDKDGMWRQLENVEDYTSLGDKAFRRVTTDQNPQRTLSFFSPSRLRDYWEQDAEVPTFPYPEPEGEIKHHEWSEEDQMNWRSNGKPKVVLAEKTDEVELDEVVFNEKSTVKELQLACTERGLPYSGSKKRMLARLIAFKIDLENKLQLSIANKLFKENQRKPMTLGQPKLPSLKEQELHFVAHWPYAPWCQACMASRAKEDKHISEKKKPELGKNVIELDFFYTYTGEERRMEDQKAPDKVQERQDQFGTCLIMASSETKAIHVVPVQSKGTASLKHITEEVIRFTLENASRDACILQADSERATRQILRAVQQVRKVMCLETEIRLTGPGQHQSNGLAERGVQTVRRLANCLRAFAGDKANIDILGNFHLYPWAFKHAAFLINRFRVLEGTGKTSYELGTGHSYRGKLALFGESVMFKRVVRNKGSDGFIRGIWCGKHVWNDMHIVLTPEGAYEARTIRRLAAEQSFNALEMVIAKGLPWNYSPQGILMKRIVGRQQRNPTVEADINPDELEEMSKTVAAGLVTPAPGLAAQPKTPVGVFAAPGTPAQGGEANAGLKRSIERQQEEESEAKRQDTTESPRKMVTKRGGAEDEQTDEKRQRTGSEESVEMEEKKEKPNKEVEHEAEGSPSMKKSRLYPPHYAGIEAVEVHGDEEAGLDYMPEDITEEHMGYGGEEGEDPPEMSEAEIEVQLDEEAKEKEIARMLKLPAMQESKEEDVVKENGYIISTKMVITWKHRLEQGGWFRRARLVARQFKSSVAMEQTFAPTSLMIIPKMMIHLWINCFSNYAGMTLDIKDAFLMSPQPQDEKAYVRIGEKVYKLLKCLPGQRKVGAQWFQLFANGCKEFGMKQDQMQPTLFIKHGEMMLTVHVDDAFMIGKESVLLRFVNFLKEKKGWKVEEKGPFQAGGKFFYLKRQFNVAREYVDIRCDRKQYDCLEKEMDLFKRAYRKTPMDQNAIKKDESPLLEDSDITKYRSVVGRLMYMASERPDAQFAIQSLAKKMAAPTQEAWRRAWHLCSYLYGTIDFGVRLSRREKGRSMLDPREDEEVDPEEFHLLEVVTDSDYAGSREDRKSTSSFQIYIDGNLIESRVRSQKAIALSSRDPRICLSRGRMLRWHADQAPMARDVRRRVQNEGEIR